MLALPEYFGFGTGWIKPVLDHIKTGYEELWSLIEKYRKTRLEWAKLYGFDPSKHQPYNITMFKKVPRPPREPVPPFIERTSANQPEKEEEWKLNNPCIEPANNLSYKKPKLSPEQEQELNKLSAELDKLNEEIVTHLSAIMFQVEHGIPLRGQCDFCPTKYVTIKEENKKDEATL